MINRSLTGAAPSRRQVRRALTAFALAVGLGTSLTACGDDSPSGDSPAAARTASNGDVFNDADVRFATDMIQHHAEALVMVDMTAGRDLDPAVAQLTEDIRAAQGSEIEQMTDWLTAWDQEVPETIRDHANAHDMDDTEGMDDLGDLENASHAEFQDMWLELMVEHHRGAVAMSEDELDDGAFDDAIAMAGRIVSSQQEEIDQMEELLG